MYIYLGGNTVISSNEILGIFDMDTSTVNKATRDYLSNSEKNKKVIYVNYELPKSFIVCKDKIIARAHNQTERLNDVTAHAEMLAITSATASLGGKYLNDCTLYVTMEPCTMCGGALAWAQLGELVYGASDPNRGYARLTPCILHPKTKVIAGVLGEECADLVRAFFIRKRD